MKASNISEETVTTNNSESNSNSDSNSENNTKPKTSISEGDNSIHEDEICDSFANNFNKNMSLNYDRLSTRAFLKTQDQALISNRSTIHRSFNKNDNNNFNSNTTKSKITAPDITQKEAELKVCWLS